MAKKSFSVPFILMDGGGLDIPTDEPISAGGSIHGGQQPFPCNFATWYEAFRMDLNGDHETDRTDYAIWFAQYFTYDQWMSIEGNDASEWVGVNPNPNP